MADRRKLSADTAARARELAALGLPLASIAAGLGIHRSTLFKWGTESPPDGPERAVINAIQEGRQQGEAALIDRLHRAAKGGDAKSAQWLLTHSPSWRQAWSDAAAERRAVLASQSRLTAVIAEARELSYEQKRMLFLRMAAAGESPLKAGDPEHDESLRLTRDWLAEMTPHDPELMECTQRSDPEAMECT